MPRSGHPLHDPRRAMLCGSGLPPVHSAHVGEGREIHYRWHPYFGLKVIVRRLERRATGQFLKVEGPSGVVVSVPAWMIDLHVCAALKIGNPQADLAALADLKRLVALTAPPANSPSETGIAREEADEEARCAWADLWPADEPDIRAEDVGRYERDRAGESSNNACTNSDAGRRSGRGGAR